MTNPWENNQSLINISTREKASTDFTENFKTMYDQGNVAMNEIIKCITKMKKKELVLRNLITIQLKNKSLLFWGQIKRKRLLSTIKDVNESYGEILSCFENKKLDLQMIMNWLVTSKPYSICNENEEICCNRKLDFYNKLQWVWPLKPTKSPPTDIKVCVVDAMRVLWLIPITSIHPPTIMKWAEAVKTYSENLLGNTLHVVLDDYSPGNENVF